MIFTEIDLSQSHPPNILSTNIRKKTINKRFQHYLSSSTVCWSNSFKEILETSENLSHSIFPFPHLEVVPNLLILQMSRLSHVVTPQIITMHYIYIHKYQGENDIQLDYLSSTGPTLSLFNHGFVGSPPAGFSALGGIFQGKECWRSYNPCHMEVPLPRPKLGEMRVTFFSVEFWREYIWIYFFSSASST